MTSRNYADLTILAPPAGIKLELRMALAFDRGALRRYIERSLQDLPAMPTVVATILEASEQPDTTASDLDRLISSDQAISSKVLRVVNSAYYGLSAKVATTSHAIVILGFQQVRNLVLSMAAMSLVKARVPGLAKIQYAFWRHSFGAAAAALLLSKRQNVEHTDRDLAHVGALLHDLGKLFLLSSFSEAYRETLQVAVKEQMPLLKAEDRVLGINHAEVGEYITSAWKFPEPLTFVVANHHGPYSELPDAALAIVHAANHYTKRAGFPAVPTPQVALDEHVAAWLDISDEDERQLNEDIQAKVEAAEELFEVL